MNVGFLRHIPFFDSTVQTWSLEARLLRWLTFLWLFIGLVVLFSASYHTGLLDSGDGLFFFKRQLLWIALGLIGFQVFTHLPLKKTLSLAWIGFFICLGMIFATHLVGVTTMGATRWISIGGFQLQPSELLKPFLILQSAQVFGHWPRLSGRARVIWLGIFALVLLGILLQPNLSTTALCGITLWLMALAAGLPYLQLSLVAIGGMLMALASICLKEYQRRRVMSFLNPWADPMQDGYQLIQSLLAVGSGGFWGTGFGLSHQKLAFLPIHHTDFIFAVFAEEFGLAGCILLLLFLSFYGFVAFKALIKTPDPVYRLVGVGAVVLMLVQSSINIAVAIGGLPTTGLPFPLFSYGGSSMIASLAIAGLLIRVAREGSQGRLIPIRQPAAGADADLSSAAAQSLVRSPRTMTSPAPKSPTPPVQGDRQSSWLSRFLHKSQAPASDRTHKKQTVKTRRQNRQRPPS
jgi:cell division protein FtsW